ncbi:type VII secretion system-associated protein [Couchioplanes caeruleus]|uniref:Type III secretion system (T3SS) SseB-like protein n=2 Tax=Couchioplanes caeruleus TaxID=56438 RepID=A0A1K0G0R1_9ACTN|nr:type VII secretion system-associated protein [Couchioplanes caeruleus]OJF10890.1 hypothetical protein BG844_29560 [Couchioplanes caeruleus subsp. caeruleus]ROP29862.1 hypothetical protein EDD30_2683 [Couchioplanes caeruleus]
MQESYFLLMDPDWRPGPDERVPPPAAVMGAWPLGGDGSVEPFRGNPGYRPRDAGAAADPLDAVLRLLSRRRAEPEQLQVLLHEARLDVALDGEEQELVVPAPDGVDCVVVATSAAQRDLADVPRWRGADLMGLVTALPDGIDVLFNPGGPVPVRLTGDFLRETLMMGDEELAEAYDHLRSSAPGPVPVLPWVLGDGRSDRRGTVLR